MEGLTAGLPRGNVRFVAREKREEGHPEGKEITVMFLTAVGVNMPHCLKALQYPF